MAAIEALVNELLAAQHPEEYAEWEIRRRKGLRQKLVDLLALHGEVASDVQWFEELDSHLQLRNTMIHHRPKWVIDDRDERSVAPTDGMTQELLDETLGAVFRAVDGLFALYRTETPKTHRRDWLSRIAREW